MNAARIALAMVPAVAWPATWRELVSPHFTLLSDSSERTAREMIVRLEQVHSFAVQSGEAPSPIPVRVYLFDSGADFDAIRSSASTRGFFQGGPDRNYIVLRDGRDVFRVAFHEYAHLLLNHSSSPLPRWFEEGLAEYFSTLETDGARLRVGAAIPAHRYVLARATWLDPPSLFGVTRDSPHYNDQESAGLFYAQSWALVHMLQSNERLRPRVATFAGLLDRGRGQLAAFEEAFGRARDVFADLGSYVAAGNFGVRELDWEPPPPAAIVTRTLSPEEAGVARAELFIAVRRPELAAALLRKAAAALPPSAALESALADVALSRRDLAEARRRYERAIELGAGGATHFEYAMLLRDTGASRAVVARHLQLAVDRNPNHAEAHFLLGTTAAAESGPEERLGHLRRAVEILPRQSYFWHALAVALHQRGDRDEAMRAAWRAREAAHTSHEREMAEAAVKLVETPVERSPGSRGPSVVIPRSWENPRGDARVEGTLEHIECPGQVARLRVRAGSGAHILTVANPNRVALSGAGATSFTFACGPQKPLAVTVEYFSATGEVTAIELKPPR
jgi:tetratricopeptide (TPR) repeat protein